MHHPGYPSEPAGAERRHGDHRVVLAVPGEIGHLAGFIAECSVVGSGHPQPLGSRARGKPLPEV
jgi:hypothetical protein